MPRFICDFSNETIDAQHREDALDLLDCASCDIDCRGPFKLLEETPGQMQLPFNTNPEEE